MSPSTDVVSDCPVLIFGDLDFICLPAHQAETLRLTEKVLPEVKVPCELAALAADAGIVGAF